MGATTAEARHARLVATMQFVQLMTRTFSTLSLTERDAIGDTISALAASFVDCRARLALLTEPSSGRLTVAARGGLDEVALLGAAPLALWSEVMDDKIAQVIDPDRLRARWPEAPAVLQRGLACVAIALHDKAIGVLAVADKLSREPFEDDELTFLSVASGLASMAVANADAHGEQRNLRELAEQRAREAAEETHDKRLALDALDRKLTIIEEQQQQIHELSTPVLRLRPEILVVPIIGVVDAQRSAQLQERLFAEVASGRRTRFVILDITGVDLVDTSTADHFVRITRAARLLGVTCVITGVSPSVALTLVGLGAELSGLLTARSLGHGVDLCMRGLG